MFVTEKKKAVTLGLPPIIASLLHEMTEGGDVNGKQKWIVFTTAVLLVHDLSDDARKLAYERVAAADIGRGSFDKLIDEAKAGTFRDDVEYDASKQGLTRRSAAKRTDGK